MMRKVGLEAVRAHPGAYARGVADTFLEELWQPLHVALPARANTAATPGSAPAPALGVDASGKAVGGAVSPLPVPTDGAQIPAAHQGIFLDARRRRARMWTSPTAHHVVLADERERRRWDAAEAKAASLAAGVPPVRQRLAHAPVQPLVEALSAAVALARGRDCRAAAQAARASRPCPSRSQSVDCSSRCSMRSPSTRSSSSPSRSSLRSSSSRPPASR